MAVVVNQNTDQQPAPGAQQGPINVGTAGGATAGTGGGVSGVTSPAAPPKPASSGQFINLQRYLGANVGAGEQLGGQITGQIQQQASKVGQEAQQAQGTIGGQLQAEKDRLAQTQNFAQQVTTDPTQITGSGQTQAFQNILQGVSPVKQLGTQTQQAFTGIGTDLNALQQQAALTGTEAGRATLLQQAVGRPSYTQGQGFLDQLLLSSQGRGALGNLQTQAQNIQQQTAQQVGAAQAGLQQGITDVTGQVAAGQSALQKALGTLDVNDPTKSAGAFGALQGQLGKQQQDFITQQNAINQAIQSGSLDPDTLGRLGLTMGENTYMSPDQLKQLITANTAWAPGTVTAGQMATPQQQAQFTALQQLAGQAAPATLTGMGTTPQGVQVNQQAIGQAIQDAQNAFINQYKPQLQNMVQQGLLTSNVNTARQDLGLSDIESQLQKRADIINAAGGVPLGGMFTNSDATNALINQLYSPQEIAGQYQQNLVAAAQKVPGFLQQIKQMQTQMAGQYNPIGGSTTTTNTK